MKKRKNKEKNVLCRRNSQNKSSVKPRALLDTIYQVSRQKQEKKFCPRSPPKFIVKLIKGMLRP